MKKGRFRSGSSRVDGGLCAEEESGGVTRGGTLGEMRRGPGNGKA